MKHIKKDNLKNHDNDYQDNHVQNKDNRCITLDDKTDFSKLRKDHKLFLADKTKDDVDQILFLLQKSLNFIKESNEKLIEQEASIIKLQGLNSELKQKVLLYEPSHLQVMKAKNTYDLYLNKIEQLKAEQKYSAKNFIEKILEPLTFFEKAIEHSYDVELNNEMKQWLSGFEMILDKLRSAILSEGLQEIIVKVGDKFNEKYHHAIEHEASSKLENGTITKVIRKGYIFHDIVLSHSLVRVVKNN
ncbi:nucleotide exchange factor GrpE [Mycoplasma sp. SG1]|uniref:nucleotide exchange factor GrpE n=1 Tax=Mycoplasma sp. SG1 TaxID=2810348 RepID=UPI002024F964|nr:nucleotide exchange factor GrpE [Mycoplasma sp. SG1]URM52792.1 nucleotide exchange factor GrpE [Mycoplasma sp. SG1]